MIAQKLSLQKIIMTLTEKIILFIVFKLLKKLISMDIMQIKKYFLKSLYMIRIMLNNYLKFYKKD